MIALFGVVVVILHSLAGRSACLALADQLVIGDHFIASAKRTTEHFTTPINRALNGQRQEFNEVVDIMAELHHSLRFEPSQIDFDAWPIGIARSHTVTLINQNENRSVYLNSVSGKTSAFYSSFFETRVVPPQGNTTFNVVFLPRVKGPVTTNLLIHTSFGQVKLKVSGEGRECPYRLIPILGLKIPLNATLTPEITIYNPHNYVLQILEVYSSGSKFQLELPSGGQDGPKSLWEIEPYATKSIIRILFTGSQPGNFTGFIRIKVGSVGMDETALVIPIEIEVLEYHGIYAENPVVDFHRLTTEDSQIIKKINLKDSLTSQELHPESINMQYDWRGYPGLNFNAKEAMFTVEPHLFKADYHVEELLLIKASRRYNSSHTQDFSLIIRAEVFRGNLEFDKNITIFITESRNSDLKEDRRLIVKNKFSLPLAILNVTVDRNASNIFHIIEEVLYPQLLQPEESVQLLRFRFINKNFSSRSSIFIHTNITTAHIPVIVCPGTLHIQTLNEAQTFAFGAYSTDLNMGLVPYAEMSQNGFIILQNRNVISIKLTSWDFKTPKGVHFHTTFLGCLRSPLLKSLKDFSHIILDTSKFTFCTHLKHQDIAAFQISIKSYVTGDSTASLMIWTPFEVITTKVIFKTWIGSLEVDQHQIHFKNCFPGQLCSSELSIRSTFSIPIRINSIKFTDQGLRFDDFNSAGSWIAPEATTKVGHIHFEPAKLCEKECYIHRSSDKWNEIAFPGQSINLREKNDRKYMFDDKELRRRTELFRHLKWYFQTISFSLNSSEIRQFQLHFIIDIEWPKLIKDKPTFQTTEVGKEQIIHVNLTNPAMDPILFDYFLSDPKFAKDTQLSLPFEVVDICLNCYLTDKDVFFLNDGVPTKPILVPPGSSKSISVRFLANSPDVYSTLLHIRNNLTLFEAVWISAKAVQSQFKFGNRKPGSNAPLLFEINEKHLSICSHRDIIQRNLDTNEIAIVTKRTFTARNTGEIPIWIKDFLIGGKKCKGFGFKVFNCTSIVLPSNSSTKIEIGFSPDFTLARVSRQLTLITNLSYDVNYLLMAVMPSVGLELCSEVLERPHWETRYKMVALIVVGMSFLLVVVAAHVDYTNVMMKQTRLVVSRDKRHVHPTFNLRAIAIKANSQSVANERKTNQSIHKSGRLQNKHNSSNLRKRGTKKNSSVLSDVDWPLALVAVKGDKLEKEVKSVHISSELEFPLKLATENISSQTSFFTTSTSNSSSESSAKSTPPKQVDRIDRDAQSLASGNKKPKVLKKSKKCMLNASNENNEKENEKPMTSQKGLSRIAKPISKSSIQSIDFNRPDRNEIERIINLETTDRGRNSVIKQKDTIESCCNEAHRKYDKTPGRERRKEINFLVDGNSLTSEKNLEHNQKKKAVNSLNFNSPALTKKSEIPALNSMFSPWKTTKEIVSFSHILQSQQNQLIPDSNYLNTETAKEPAWSKQQISTKCVQEATTEKNNVFQAYSSQDNLNSTELGPIGSRKSPSSTPVWEPLSDSMKSVSSDTKQALSNSSFFSNLLPSIDYSPDNHSPHLIDMSQPVVSDVNNAEKDRHCQWQANEYFFNMHQRQMNLRQQMQDIEIADNWGVISQTWAPMSYTHNSTNASSSWQQTATIRPPPGLEQNSFNRMLSTTSTSVSTDNPANSVSPAQEQSIQTFDPFSSLSSIWSENWNKSHRNEME